MSESSRLRLCTPPGQLNATHVESSRRVFVPACHHAAGFGRCLVQPCQPRREALFADESRQRKHGEGIVTRNREFGADRHARCTETVRSPRARKHQKNGRPSSDALGTERCAATKNGEHQSVWGHSLSMN